jgi:hypothetical protein
MSISTLIGKVNLSLFNGGNDQKFILQNPTILKEKTDHNATNSSNKQYKLGWNRVKCVCKSKQQCF